MKKLLALLLAAALILSMAACGKTEDPDNTESTDPTVNEELDELYRRDSYTVTDDEAAAARETVVATAGDAELTNGMLQIYYWLGIYTFLNDYSSYLSYFGLDHTAPLDEQECPDTDGTWQHYFLDSALNTWQNYQALALAAEANNVPMEESLQKQYDDLEETLTTSASENGFESVDAMLQADAGAGCTLEDYKNYMGVYLKGYNYFTQKYDAVEITDDMINEYFTEHEAELAEEEITKDSGDVHDVRHILIEIEGGTKDEEGNVTYSDAEWAACKDKAQSLLDQWLAGEATEETFAEFAAEHSTDTGSSSNGGLYTDLNDETNFVEEFKNWYLDESRQPGDYGLVKSTYGYHIMYYSACEAQWIRESRYYLLDEAATQIVTDVVDQYPITVDYDAIVLGEVDLAE